MADDRDLELENRVLRAMIAESRPDGFNGLPRWVRMIGVLGFPAFIATYFLARDAGYVPSVFTSTSSQMAAMQQALVEHRTRQELMMRVLTTGLRVICINDAGVDQKKINRCQEIQ
jgi:hypothetical protein